MPGIQPIEDEEEEEAPPVNLPKRVPTFGSVEWIYYWSDVDGPLPSPINISITGALKYTCPELKWYNFDVFPHKIKMTNTGYTILIAAKWKTERPYVVGGPFLEKHIMSQIHFHWGPDLFHGSDHSVDNMFHPAEMQVVFFKSEYLTQQEAILHHDGVTMFCYLLKDGVLPDPRMSWIVNSFPKIRPAESFTRIGPLPMSQLIPMFAEDYFIYWGTLTTAKGENHVIRWLVPRVPLYVTMEQMKEFRKMQNPWDLPNLSNSRPIQEVGDRHVFLINAHWNLYNTLLPLPRVPEPSISELSPEYLAKPWMLPPQNAYMLPEEPEPEEETQHPPATSWF